MTKLNRINSSSSDILQRKLNQSSDSSTITNRDLLKIVLENQSQTNERFHDIDNRFDNIDNRFDGMNNRFDGVDKLLEKIISNQSPMINNTNSQSNTNKNDNVKKSLIIDKIINLLKKLK